MEGQGPSWKSPSPAADTAAVASSLPCTTFFLGDFSCAVLPDELGLLALNMITVLIDSGASSHLIQSKEYFWMYSLSQARNVKTANHSILRTLATGIASPESLKMFALPLLSFGTASTDTCVNFVSVGRMVANGMACTFNVMNRSQAWLRYFLIVRTF